MKWVLAFLVGMIVGAYNAFVAMCFWNWFATRALHVPTLSYLEMLGLVWLLQILRPGIREDSGQWMQFWALVEHLVPDNKREAAEAALRDLERGMWSHAVSLAFGQVMVTTVMLGLGFALHEFLLP